MKNVKLRKNSQLKKQFIKTVTVCALLCITVLVLSYYIFQTNLLEPGLDEITTSYISFNNKNTTDMLKIDNLKKMKNEKGRSFLNDRKVTFQVSGKEQEEYQVILYPLTNIVDLKYIHFSLEEKEPLISGTLDSVMENEDGVITIYTGFVKNPEEKMTLKMWIDKKYKGNSNHTSFEIKIKSR